MIKNKCRHVWEKHTNTGYQENVGTISTTFICKKCRTVMTASEVFQLEALEKQTKMIFILIFSVVFSALAVMISFIK